MWSILHNNIPKITHAGKTRLTPSRVTWMSPQSQPTFILLLAGGGRYLFNSPRVTQAVLVVNPCLLHFPEAASFLKAHSSLKLVLTWHWSLERGQRSRTAIVVVDCDLQWQSKCLNWGLQVLIISSCFKEKITFGITETATFFKIWFIFSFSVAANRTKEKEESVIIRCDIFYWTALQSVPCDRGW